MPSPFPPIEHYAFLSNCHTGALVAPDGAIGWLCVPLSTHRACSPPCSIARRATSAWDRSASTSPPRVRTSRAPTSSPRRGTRRAVVGRRPGCPDHGTALGRGRGDASHATSGRRRCRPRPRPDGGVHRRRGRDRARAEPVFDYGRVHRAEWTLVDGSRHTADASGGGMAMPAADRHGPGDRGRAGPGAATSSGRASRCTAPCRGPAVWPRRTTASRPAPGWTRRSGSGGAGWQAGAHPGPPLSAGDRAVGAGDQGTDLHAHGGDGGRPDHLVAGDPWRRAQLGLPLHVDARHDLHPPGPPLPRPRLGGRRVHPVRQRPRGERRRRPPDHVRHRRPPEPDRDDPGPPHGLPGREPVRVGNGAFDQRQNDVFGAVLDSILLHTRRTGRLPRGLWPIVQSQATCATNVWRGPDQGIWEARGKPQHYVSSKLMGWVALDRAAKLAEIRGDPDIPRRPGGRPPTRSRPTSWSTASTDAACCGSTTRPMRSARVDAPGGPLRLPAGRRRAPARDHPRHRR